MKQKLWELIWLTALIFSSISAHAATRIALVSSCGGAAGADVLALAEARLSQQPDMAIVERREVERILQEQQLWQRGRTDYTQALSAGKLLGVDVFVSLEMFPDSKDVLGLIIFDASNGVRLWDAALPSGELEQKAKAIQEAVRIACAKRERTQENFRTVCLVTVRNADLPRELDNLCDTVGVLLERNLTSSTNLLVLERRRLEQVTRERGLPTGEVTSNLFASVTLLEIEVARGSSNRTLQAMALLSTASGKVIDKVSIQSGNQNPVELADSLLAKLLTALHAAQPAQPVDRLAETKRFQEEAKFQFWQRDFVHAITTAEAALALMPEEQTFFPTFFTCLSSAIRQLLASPNRSDWEYALRLIRRLQDMVKIGSQECDPAAFDRRANVDRAKIDQEKFNSDLEKYKIASSGRSCLISCLSNARRYDFGNDRQLQERLAAIQEDHRRWLLESINQLHPAGTASLSAFLRYSQAVFGSDAELGSVARSPREWTTDAIALRAKWIALAQDYLNHENAPESSLQGCLHNFVPAIGQPESRLRNSAAVAPAPFKLTAEDCTLWRAYFRSIDQDPSAILRFYGTLGELWADINAQSVSTNEATRRTESLVALAKEMITRVDAQTDFIQSGYRGALDAIEYFPTEPQRYQARLALVDFMLSRCELSEIVVRAPGSEEVFKNVARLLEQSALRPLGNDCSGFIREHYGTDGKTNSVGPAVPWINARLLFDGQSRGAKGIKALAHDAEHVYLVVDRNDLSPA